MHPPRFVSFALYWSIAKNAVAAREEATKPIPAFVFFANVYARPETIKRMFEVKVHFSFFSFGRG